MNSIVSSISLLVCSNVFMTFTGKNASAAAAKIRIALPAANHAAIRFALDSGLRLTSSAHFLSSGTVGMMEQYIPSGQSLY